jgi:hypothetical protein
MANPTDILKRFWEFQAVESRIMDLQDQLATVSQQLADLRHQVFENRNALLEPIFEADASAAAPESTDA